MNDYTRRIAAAIQATKDFRPNDKGWNLLLEMCTHGVSFSFPSHPQMEPKELEQTLKTCDWQLAEDISGTEFPVVTFQTRLPGRLSFCKLQDCTRDAQLYLEDVEKAGFWQLFGNHPMVGTLVDFTTILLVTEDGKEMVYGLGATSVDPCESDGGPVEVIPFDALPATLTNRLSADGRIMLTAAEALTLGIFKEVIIRWLSSF